MTTSISKTTMVDSTETTETKTKNIASTERRIDLRVAPVVAAARDMYGLRDRDYARYRGYCTRKVATQRRQAGLVQGAGEVYDPQPVIAATTTAALAPMLVVLFNAERCWAHAMEIKQQLVDDRRKRHHMVGRLNRAAHHATLLRELAEAWPVTQRTKREAQAYASLLEGHCAFEKEDFVVAVEHYLDARGKLELLADVSSWRRAAPYNVVINALNPNLRYCAYSLSLQGLPSGLDGVSLDPRPVKPHRHKNRQAKNKTSTTAETTKTTTKTTMDQQVETPQANASEPARNKTTSTEDVDDSAKVPITSSLNDEVDQYEESEDGFQSADEEQPQNEGKGWLSRLWGTG